MSNDTWVSDMELAARGIGFDAQRVRRNTGRLRHTSIENGGYAYRQADIDSWLAGANTGQAATAPPPARHSGGGGSSAGGASAEWKAAVQKLTNNGTPAAEAIRHIDATRPGLRERMLQEHNAGRRDAPPALAHFKRLGGD